MTNLALHLSLKSDASFGRGDGLAGLVDAEVQHDDYGFPYIGGRVLKGLLVEECANLLFALSCMKKSAEWLEEWIAAADALFGTPGSGIDEFARLRIGQGELPVDFRHAAVQAYAGKQPEQMRADILPALTAIRRQTAVDAVTGAPKKETLRITRVVLRDTSFVASVAIEPDVDIESKTDQRILGLLAACVLALRRGGSDRNRGRGELVARLLDGEDDVTDLYYSTYFANSHFSEEVHS